MKSKAHRQASFLNLLVASALIAAFLILPLRAANPTGGSINPTVGATVNWTGTAPGGTSPIGEQLALTEQTATFSR